MFSRHAPPAIRKNVAIGNAEADLGIQETDAVNSRRDCARSLVIDPHRPPVGTMPSSRINPLSESPRANSRHLVRTASVVSQAIMSRGTLP
jgi:hypothetical protein